MSARHKARVDRLVNLLGRGRTLHYQNASRQLGKLIGRELPKKPSATADLVYAAVQVICSFTFIEDRGYLDDADYDPFTDAVFARIAEGRAERLLRIVETYGGVYADSSRFAQVVASDVCAALVGQTHPTAVKALLGVTRGVQKTSQLYCAMTFNDRAMVAKLQ